MRMLRMSMRASWGDWQFTFLQRGFLSRKQEYESPHWNQWTGRQFQSRAADHYI